MGWIVLYVWGGGMGGSKMLLVKLKSCAQTFNVRLCNMPEISIFALIFTPLHFVRVGRNVGWTLTSRSPLRALPIYIRCWLVQAIT